MSWTRRPHRPRRQAHPRAPADQADARRLARPRPAPRAAAAPRGWPLWVIRALSYSLSLATSALLITGPPPPYKSPQLDLELSFTPPTLVPEFSLAWVVGNKSLWAAGVLGG